MVFIRLQVMQRAVAQGVSRVGVVAAGLAVAGGGLVYALENSVHASEEAVHPFKLPWSHSGPLESFDIASVRRGYEVYKQVCAACHSLKYIHYRHFVDTIMTEEEAKAEAAEALINDVDDKGRAIQRPGILTDALPSPYPNVKAAAAANNGAAPPDLSLMSLARHGGDDYIFALLTGYFDPPAGIKVDEGKAYNPYFPGGVISMPQQLYDEGIEYKDGTPATQSQQAKDVATFMHWCAEPFHDTRKRWGLKEEAKAEAAEALINDVDDKGRAIQRPGILTDALPSPYPNVKAAAAANNGAAPPDLSLMSLARHGGDDYIFALLTGYFDPPAGIKVDEGKAYNPYFPGGVISMPQQLYDEGIEYKDGTPATQSQQAKDVATFMHWCAEPFHDTRKRWGLKI
ncbi:cytochrome C1 family protein [Teladorsagia circumcincta]|uniref:Cytochrome C1 family protein n=1 Tax=Teladorsagia circumcincta TaxID=45464 RepID=A0A2G9UJ85_TELCI|nr:cytochrome C1 family protein [Teladorsagia circumcincta]